MLLVMSAIFATAPVSLLCQDTPLKYEIDRIANIDYSHGQLPSTMGVHNIQIMRANREHPEFAEGFGWTYNHAPMIAYHPGGFRDHSSQGTVKRLHG